MNGYTENSIVVYGKPMEIFKLTNEIKKWPELFTEYKEVEVLNIAENIVTFKLTTLEGNSWVSERKIDEEHMLATAKRLYPMFPFKETYITWQYEELPQDLGVVMTWIQEFDVDPQCGHDIYDMESYLNRTTRTQMKAVKRKVESILNEKSMP